MEIFGIKFAPLNIPMERRLQTLAAGTWFVVFALGGFIGLFLAMYILFYTKFWFLMVIYLTWAWVIDIKNLDTGGRRIAWMRRWSWWMYFRDYFPIKLVVEPGVEFDKTKNYLLCCFPHGMLPAGPFNAFASTGGGFHEKFPHHTPFPLTLTQHFYMPFYRELIFGLGGVAASPKSMSYLLSSPKGGNAPILVVGGATESFNCRPGEYKLVLKNRKGFVKQALKHGSPLVPVFTFGETDLFNQVSNPEGSLLRKIQEKLKNIIGIAPALPMGRGFFQYSFGMVPLRKPVTTVIGKPINVVKMETPTKEKIDEVHKHFVDCLMKLFEEHKHKYIKNPDTTELIIQ